MGNMIIYNDLITGDELISDSYNLKEVDGAVYEADCSKITIGGESVDIGANPSAEEADEGADDSKQQVIDVVHSFRLNETSFDKKSYLSHLKGYMKEVKQKMKDNGAGDDQVNEFQSGESMNPDGMVILLNYREDGMTPYVTIW